MKVYFEINSAGTNKVEVVNLIYNGTDYVPVRKNVIIRDHMTPFVYDISSNTMKVFIENLGEFTLSQHADFDADEKVHKVLKVNDVDVIDNDDLYNKLKAL